MDRQYKSETNTKLALNDEKKYDLNTSSMNKIVISVNQYKQNLFPFLRKNSHEVLDELNFSSKKRVFCEW